jgi:hypothetical protein
MIAHNALRGAAGRLRKPFQLVWAFTVVMSVISYKRLQCG